MRPSLALKDPTVEVRSFLTYLELVETIVSENRREELFAF